MAGKRSNEDFLADLVRQFTAVAPELGPARLDEIARAVDRHIRHDWGGCRPYIRKGNTPQQKTKALASALSTGAALGEVFAQAEVSTRHGYRLISRRSK